MKKLPVANDHLMHELACSGMIRLKHYLNQVVVQDSKCKANSPRTSRSTIRMKPLKPHWMVPTQCTLATHGNTKQHFLVTVNGDSGKLTHFCCFCSLLQNRHHIDMIQTYIQTGVASITREYLKPFCWQGIFKPSETATKLPSGTCINRLTQVKSPGNYGLHMFLHVVCMFYISYMFFKALVQRVVGTFHSALRMSYPVSTATVRSSGRDLEPWTPCASSLVVILW